MANVQLKNGYTPIANELLEVIYGCKFNATELKIIMVICRYTYGFSRKQHSLSESFIAKAVNISKRYISLELNKLVELGVITIIKAHTDVNSRVLELNKNYDMWLIDRNSKKKNNTSLGINNSTGVEKMNTTVEQFIEKPDEQLIYQEKQDLKQQYKQAEIIWDLYPNKIGKAKIFGKIPKLINEFSFEQLERCIQRYKSTKETWKSWKHGSTFFNDSYVDYLDCNFVKELPIGINKISQNPVRNDDY